MNGSKLRQLKQPKKEAMKQFEKNIADANAMSNPLSSLPKKFLTIDIPDGGETISTNDDAAAAPAVAADRLSTPSDGDPLPATSARSMSVDFFKSPLPPDLHASCLALFERNMGSMYHASSWGLDMDEKSNELRHKDARFLVVAGAENKSVHSGKGRCVVAFAHFRFEADDEEDPTEEVLYLYEIQVDGSSRRMGLGKRLMNIVEIVAMRSKMRRLILTVFKNNHAAMKFYSSKMKYRIDDSSPSNYEGGDDCDYEILSKAIGKVS